MRVTLRRPIGRWLPVPDGHVLAVDRSVRTEATNAGLLAASIVSITRPTLRHKLQAWRAQQTNTVLNARNLDI